MDKVRDLLFSRQDKEYGAFTRKLTPGLTEDNMIGVRFPDLKAIYKELDEAEKALFMRELPHKYFEENNLHAVIISHIKDETECIEAIEAFLPYIDNWATCDTMIPAVFKKRKGLISEKAKEWIKSDKVYTVRTGVGIFMRFFLDADFKPEYNELVAGIVSDEYYVNMMCAWYFATALAKQYEATIPYLETRALTPAVHKMTVKKAVESYRVTEERKKIIRATLQN